MNEIGIDISHHKSKDVQQFQNQKFDLVITVCDNAKENCPVSPGTKTIHWSLPDPENKDDFRKVRTELERYVTDFLFKEFS